MLNQTQEVSLALQNGLKCIEAALECLLYTLSILFACWFVACLLNFCVNPQQLLIYWFGSGQRAGPGQHGQQAGLGHFHAHCHSYQCEFYSSLHHAHKNRGQVRKWPTVQHKCAARVTALLMTVVDWQLFTNGLQCILMQFGGILCINVNNL